MNIEELNLSPSLIKAVKELGYEEFTEIQQKCIPLIFESRDIFGQSKTGSGKTAAFGLPILQNITSGKGIQALILTPTRELCVQVTEALRQFGKFLNIRTVSVYGGVGIEPQITALKTAEIVVGTPGRIQDHINRRTISFHNVKILVLDEADKMFEMGFLEAVEEILKSVPKERQTLLFSATLSKSVLHIVKKHLKSPTIIKTEEHVDKSLLKQVYYNVKYYEKFSLLVHLIKQKESGLALVFCATRREVDSLTKNLKMQKIRTMAIHGGLTQNKRQYALEELKKENIQVLVATDVAGRGLDIKNISHVYNYDVPKTSEEYIHRIGRTARAGMKGDAVTLLSEKDHANFDSVLRNRSIEIHKNELPVFPRVPFIRHQNTQRRGFSSDRREGYNKDYSNNYQHRRTSNYRSRR